MGLVYFNCLVAVSVLYLFLKVPWAGLQCVIVVFPGDTPLLFDARKTDFVSCKQ